MESLDIPQLVAVVLIMVFATTTFSALGFGIGLVAMPLLLLLLDAQTSIISLNAMALVTVVFVALRNRSYIRIKDTVPIGIGGIVGALVGSFALSEIDSGPLSIVILVLILVFTLGTFLNLNISLPKTEVIGPLVGFITGLLITAIGVGGGPIMVLYLLSRGWHRHTVRASMALFFIIMLTTAVGGYTVAGLITPELWTLLGIVTVPSIIGFWLGDKLAYRINDNIFRKAVIYLILITTVIALAREVSLI